MATTTLTVLPKRTGPSDALRNLSIANTPKKNPVKENYISTVAASPSATPPTRDPNFNTKLDSIKTQALYIQDLLNKRKAEEEKMGNTGGGPSNALKEMSSALSPRPKTPDFYGGAKSAMDKYVESLAVTDEENKISKNISNIRSSISSGMQQASEQAIPLNFITGQQQAIENRGLNMLDPMEAELERLFKNREAKSEGLNARQKFETALGDTNAEDYRYQDEVARDERRYAYDVAQEASKPIEFNGALYQRNHDGGFTELLSAPPETPEPFELSEGQDRYEFNSKTGKYELVASKGKTYKPESGSGSSVTAGRTQQILDGFIKLEDLTLAERQKVQDELYDLGFASAEVPEWYNEYYTEEGNQGQGFNFETSPRLTAIEGNKNKPKTVKESWNEYRNKIIKAATAKSGSGGLDDINIDNL